MSDSRPPPNNNNNISKILSKQRTWSPDIHRDIEWEKLKIKQRRRYRQLSINCIDGVDNVKNEVKVEVNDDDLKELKGCFELGFGFDSFSELDPKLIQAFPALEMYAAMNRSRILPPCTSLTSDSPSSSSINRVTPIINPSDDSQKVKMKLKQWAQLVTCSLIETSSPSISKKQYRKTS